MRTSATFHHGPIGCQVRDGAVRMAQWQRRHGRIEHVFGSAPLPANADKSAAIAAMKQALAGAAFAGTAVVTNLPAESVCYRHVRLGRVPDGELGSALAFQLAGDLQWSRGEFSCSFYDMDPATGRRGNGRDVFAVAASFQCLSPCVQALREAGLSPLAVEDEAGSIVRSLISSDPESPLRQPHMLIVLGEARSVLIAVQAGVPCLVRLVHHRWDRSWSPAPSSCDLTGEVAGEGVGGQSDGSITPGAICASEIAREAVMCMHYLSERLPEEMQPRFGVPIGSGSDEEIRRVFAAHAGLECRTLAECLSGEVRERFAPLLAGASLGGSALVQDERRNTGETPVPPVAWLPAIGLAHYDVAASVQSERSAMSINLMPANEGRPAATGRRRVLRRRAPSPTLVLLGVAVAWYVVARAQISRLDSHIADAEVALHQLRGLERDRELEAQEQIELTQQLAAITGIRNPLSAVRVLALLSHVAPEDVTISMLAVDVPAARGGGSVGPKRSGDDGAAFAVMLQGQAGSHASLAHVVRALAEHGVTNVSIDQSKEVERVGASGSSAVEFRMTMRVPMHDAAVLLAAGVTP